MNLSYRPASPHETPSCLDMLPDGLKLSAADRTVLAALLRKWRIQGMLRMTVIEHTDELGVQSLVGFGMSMFVTDQYASYLETKSQPPVLMDLARSTMAGEKPLLTPDELRVANSTDGLNLLIPIIGWQNDIEDPSLLSRIKAKLIDAFHFTHGGFNIKDMLQEIYSETEMKRALAAGAFVRSDYSVAGVKTDLPECELPYIIGVRRENAVEGTWLHTLYLFNPPKFNFTASEQSVLELAILDMTDSQIASALHLGEATIKKRWRSIIERATAARHVPWYPHDSAVKGEANEPSKRGLEKRRYIITYVRSHLEELRPYAPRKD